MTAKTKSAAFDIKLEDDGTTIITFGDTTVEFGPILMGQFRKLRADLKECDAKAQEYVRTELAAAKEIVAWNDEHKDDEGFDPKEYEPNDLLFHDVYAGWWKQVDAELAVKGHLPEDSELWPPTLASPAVIKKVVDHWQFDPLDRGGE